MKRITLIVGLLFAFVAAYAQGIGSAKDLQEFITAYNNGESVLQWCDADSTICLTADIDLAKAKNLPQINNFAGKFDGKGFRLRNWKASRGLFLNVSSTGVVQNLIIDASCTLKSVGKGDEHRVGFIADINEGIIQDCVNYGNVTHTCKYALAHAWVGGLVGHNKMAIYRCRNYGNVTSDTSGEPRADIWIVVGGICGGTPGKVPQGATISRCVNEGQVKAVTNLQSFYVGGVAGYPGRATVKFCTNKGEVTADIREDENGGTKGVARVGGVVGQTKGDIARCENFGSVTSSGACSANIGGIVGMPHESLVIADCLNYGKVTSTGDLPSQTGGIAGNVGRPVHIHRCINFGDVTFDGVSSRNRSATGGIAGNVYTVKDATAGAYIRGCVNYGKIRSANGGNRYDATNRNAIHTAGVVGCFEAREDIRAFLKDCANHGSVTADGGRKGDIYASAVAATTGGAELTDWAVAIDAPVQGNNVVGSIKTSAGEPWAGVVVTDGFQCVTTDADGRFAMNSDFETAGFVYFSVPADASIPVRDGLPQTYKRIPRHVKAVQADFVLDKKPVSENYTVVMIADPQVRPFGVDGSMETWHDRVAPDVEAFRASCDGPVYCINLGDLVYNYMAAWDDYMDGAAKINCPTFNVIGNHDYDQGTLFETEQGNVFYESYVGPTHYSFDLGDIHYMVFNDIIYDRKSPTGKYYYGLDERTLAWVKADLAYVPKDKIIVTCSHHNPFKTPNTSPNGSHNAYSLNYKEYLSVFAQYKAVYAWNGHNHENFYYNYAGKETRHGAPNIQCISVARCTGALRFNREIAAKGEPQGYMVMEVDGESLNWYYKGVGTGKETQMRAYSPTRTGDATVRVNIWNWSEGWSTPEWYENGVKVSDMTFTPGVDLDYLDLYNTIENKTTKKYCTPLNTALIFSVIPSPGVTKGEIRVTDLFGNVYTEEVSW